MPRLLQIDSCLGILSTGRITEGIAALASENGWECHIAHGARYVGRSNMQSHQVETRFGEYLHFAGSLLFDRHGLGSVEATKRLVDKIETEIKPDIIHLHCIHGYYLNYEVLFEYLNRTDIPVVWTFHDCWAFTGHCAHFVTAGCDRWMKEGCGHCPLLHTYPRSFSDSSARNFVIKRNAFQAKDRMHIVAVSEWMSSLVGESFLKEKQLSVINNGVDIETFRPCSDKKRQFTVLGVASSWEKEKGLNDFTQLREKLPAEDFDIVLVGLTKRQISSLPQGIVGICRTDFASELAQIYSGASVLVNPTYADTFPTVNLEALACGTPVITYDTGGSPEAVDENTGVVVPQGDVDGLVDAVMKMKDLPLSSDACRQRAITLYDRNVSYRKYLSLYDMLLV